MKNYTIFNDNVSLAWSKPEIAYLASNLREADKQEIEAATGPHKPTSPKGLYSLILEEIEASDAALVVYEPNTRTPMAIVGAGHFPEFPHMGDIWLHATPAIENHKFSFLKAARHGLRFFADNYNVLSCSADERNELHTRWLQWLGFVPLSRHIYYDPAIPFIKYVLGGGVHFSSLKGGGRICANQCPS